MNKGRGLTLKEKTLKEAINVKREYKRRDGERKRCSAKFSRDQRSPDNQKIGCREVDLWNTPLTFEVV